MPKNGNVEQAVPTVALPQRKALLVPHDAYLVQAWHVCLYLNRQYMGLSQVRNSLPMLAQLITARFQLLGVYLRSAHNIPGIGVRIAPTVGAQNLVHSARAPWSRKSAYGYARAISTRYPTQPM